MAFLYLFVLPIFLVLFTIGTSPIWGSYLFIRNRRRKAETQFLAMPMGLLENIPQNGIKVPVVGIYSLHFGYGYNHIASTILLGPDFFEYNIFFTKRIYYKDIQVIDVGSPISIFLPKIDTIGKDMLKIKVKSFFPYIVFLGFSENVLNLLIPFFHSKNIKFSPKALEVFSRFATKPIK